MREPRVVILGPPGAGKGTQSAKIASEYGIEHITTGDALRANKEMDISQLEAEYDTPGDYMDAGDLVPDEVVTAIVEEALSDTDGFVLDGYPRTVSQAQALDGMTDLDVVLSIEVGREELIARLTGRRVCPDCGRNYHVEFDPPETPGVCDACGGELIQREDDRRAAVENRLDVFADETAPVIDYYRDHRGFEPVDGEHSPTDVWADIADAIAAHVE